MQYVQIEAYTNLLCELTRIESTLFLETKYKIFLVLRSTQFLKIRILDIKY